MSANCPICGRPLNLMETIVAEHDPAYQCRHCWNRIQATGPVNPPGPARQLKKKAPAGRWRHLTRS